MKHTRILALAASTVTVGLLAACGTTSTPSVPEAQPFPRERQCQDIQRPADPYGFIGSNWFKDDACVIFNLNRPGQGVGQEQAEKIVYDARMKMMMGKRDIAMLVALGNKQTEHPTGVVTDFAGVIAQRYSTIKDELDASSLALQGKAPEGFSLAFSKTPSASPGLEPSK